MLSVVPGMAQEDVLADLLRGMNGPRIVLVVGKLVVMHVGCPGKLGLRMLETKLVSGHVKWYPNPRMPRYSAAPEYSVAVTLVWTNYPAS